MVNFTPLGIELPYLCELFENNFRNGRNGWNAQRPFYGIKIPMKFISFVHAVCIECRMWNTAILWMLLAIWITVRFCVCIVHDSRPNIQFVQVPWPFVKCIKTTKYVFNSTDPFDLPSKYYRRPSTTNAHPNTACEQTNPHVKFDIWKLCVQCLIFDIRNINKNVHWQIHSLI